MTIHKVERIIDGVKYSIETGRMAKQAHGAVTVQAGGTIVLVTAVVAPEPLEDGQFTPLTVDYREQYYSVGKIPGGFFKRESKPDERQTLTARLIDRPIRPLIPEGFYHEIVVTALVISSDGKHSPDILAMNGASAALAISKIPFNGPIGGVKVGKINGKLIANPTFDKQAESELSIIVASTRSAICMVEAGVNNLPEDEVIEAIEYGKKIGGEFVELINELVSKVGQEKMPVIPPKKNEELEKEIRSIAFEKIKTASSNPDKIKRLEAIDTIVSEVVSAYKEKLGEEIIPEIKSILELIEVEIVREDIIKKGIRPDGRKPEEIRPITIEIAPLPCAHGSALFTRGQTQALGVTTLGTALDRRRRDDIESEEEEVFLFHYNFPPFSVAEAKPIRGTGRREIGHGALAGRALQPLIPDQKDFPYTIRVVSDILESNGSSSMASVCAGSLSMMDAGVPIKTAAAGIAMGLITDETGNYAILTDIQGLEDHFGDMDFKVAGTRTGITALQMDIKIEGLTVEIMKKALEQAKKARIEILDKMDAVLSSPKQTLADNAPRLITMRIPEEKIKDVIGPGGKMIKKIQSESKTELNLDDNGILTIAAWDNESGAKAKEMVEAITAEAELGRVYEGKVARLMKFGAFVEFMPGQEGLVHISQLDIVQPKNVEDIVKEGDLIKVKVIEKDRMGRYNLSRKAVLLSEQGLSDDEIKEAYNSDMESRGNSGGSGGSRGRYENRGRDRDRGDRSNRSDRSNDRSNRREGRGDRYYKSDID